MRWRFASGYAAGGLIQRLRQDFRELECAATAPGRAEFRSPDGAVQFAVAERVEPHFMLQIATAEFSCRCPRRPNAADAHGGAVVVRHRGRLRRTGIEFCATDPATDATREIERTLSNAAELNAALLPLDFTHCRVQLEPHSLELRLRHFGACEIVGQLPKFRRYVRLGAQQRDSMLKCFGAFRRIIEAQPT